MGQRKPAKKKPPKKPASPRVVAEYASSEMLDTLFGKDRDEPGGEIEFPDAADAQRSFQPRRFSHHAQVAYFCPKCQNIDVEITQPRIIDVTKKNGGATFHCPLCGASGGADELIGALSPENKKFWNTERIGQVMLRAGTKVAAGPLLQVLELIGLIPRVEVGTPEQQADALKVREAVAKDVIASFVEAAFTASAQHAVPHFERFGYGIEAREALIEGAHPDGP